jgi:DNA-binding transcriptional LysR family regulator
MALNTDMLEAFVQVASHLSVSRAADQLHVSKSLVSKRVAQLEDAVRATLFSRSTRHIALTPAGEVYLDYARRALLDAAAAEERLKNLRSELMGLIRISAPVSWGQRVLSAQLPEFLLLHPGVELELQLSDRLVDVAQEKFDLCLRWATAAAHDLVSLPVARVNFVMCASPKYLARQGQPAHPSELSRHECIAYWREPSDDKWHLFNGTEKVDLTVHGRLRVNDTEVASQAALAGLGIALLPRYSVDAGLVAGRLLPVLADWIPDTRFGTWIAATQSPDRAQLARSQALITYLRQRLAVN